MRLDGKGEYRMGVVAYMKRLFQIVGLILAFGWLPMTQHCRIEAMGAKFMQCQHATHAAGCDCCSQDGCGTLENGGYKLSSIDLYVGEPKLFASLFVIELPAALTVETTQPMVAPEEHVRNLNWVPTWHFVRRAAPSPRAPSVSLA